MRLTNKEATAIRRRVRIIVGDFIYVDNGELSIVEDITQEAMLRILLAHTKDADEIRNIARNTARNFLRVHRERGYKVTLWQDYENPEFSPEVDETEEL